jgi:hypothetical protein
LVRWLLLALFSLLPGEASALPSEPPPARVLRVCADPGNLPFSNQQRQGFENQIAQVLARRLRARLEYTWWAQRRGFFRNTLNAGVCETEARVAILHRNVPNMLSQITAFFGSNGLNIENLSNKARGQYAYTLLDISHPMPRDTVERLREIGGVLRVRRVAENI